MGGVPKVGVILVPMTKPKTRLQEAIDDAIANFANELITIIRRSTVEELAGLSLVAPSTRPETSEPAPRAVPDTGPSAVPEPVEAVGQAEPSPTASARSPKSPKARKKRAWPTCSTPGCTSKMYGPSGANKLCYQHHMEGGGNPSPFASRKKTGSPAEDGLGADAQAQPKGRKVIRRRKGEEPTGRASATQSGKPEPSDSPPLSAKDGGLRRVEAQLAREKA